MNALKMAEAVTRFRLLRSLGVFSPAARPGQYTYILDKTGRNVELLSNGAPNDAARLTVRQIFDGFNRELAMLCEQHFSAETSRG